MDSDAATTLVCPKPSPLKPSPGKPGVLGLRRLRFSQEVSDQAERELSSIFVSSSENITSLGLRPVRAQTPSPTNVMDSPSPKRRLSSSSPFSPLMRAQNPSTNASPDCLAEGAELGLLAFSPEHGRHRGSFSSAYHRGMFKNV